MPVSLLAIVGLALPLPMQASPAALPTLATRLELPDLVTDLTLDLRGGRLFTVTVKGTVNAWKLGDGTKLWESTELGTRWVNFCGKTVLCGLTFTAVTEFDSEDGTKRSSVGGPVSQSTMTGCATDTRGRWIWFGGDNGLARLTPGDVQGWSRRKVENGGVTVLATDEEGDLLAVGGRDGSVRFVNVKSANVDDKKVLTGTGGPVTALAVGSKALVAAAEDGSVRVWTISSGKEKLVLAGSGSPARALALDEKAGWVLSGDAQGTLVLWSLAKGVELGRWPVEGGAAIRDLELATKERRLYVAAGPRVLELDLTSLK